jgi:hypothetical protein
MFVSSDMVNHHIQTLVGQGTHKTKQNKTKRKTNETIPSINNDISDQWSTTLGQNSGNKLAASNHSSCCQYTHIKQKHNIYKYKYIDRRALIYFNPKIRPSKEVTSTPHVRRNIG